MYYKIILVLFHLFLLSCATKIRTPLNRMISPESVGGVFNSEIQLSKVNSSQGKFDISSTAPYPVKTSEVVTSSYWWAVSFLESLDLFWWHTASSSSLFGFRFQILGNSQSQNPQGHSLAVTAAIGGNPHETNTDPKLDMRVGAQDYSLIYGLWMASFFQINTSVFYSTTTLQGDLTSNADSTLNSELDYKNKQSGVTLGLTGAFSSFNLKLEYAYTQSKWSESSAKTFSSLGIGVGMRF